MRASIILISILMSTFVFSQNKNDVRSLIGLNIREFGDTVQLDGDLIVNGGGYMLARDERYPDTAFGISSWHSSSSHFYLFEKFTDAGVIVLDIWELKKADVNLKKHKLVQLCETTEGADTEIFAVVRDNKNNPEFYTKVVKAWRANRKTEKFEPIKQRKVKRCTNEGYGI